MWQAATLSGLLVMSAMFIELCTTCQVDIVLRLAAQHASAFEAAVQHGCAHLSLRLVS